MNWTNPEIPEKYRKLYEQARAGKPKAAIRLHCLECCGFDAAEVDRCTAPGCGLFVLRNKKAQAETEGPNRAKRRAVALACGLKPPKHASAHGHGDRQQAPNLNATDSV